VTVSSFVELGVAEPIVRALDEEGYRTPTPIQARAIPELLAGKDLLGIAQTGTGKTAAFAVPLLQILAATKKHAGPKGTRALILAPTRELAIQIGDGFKTYGRHLGLRSAVIFGGVGQNPQVRAMARGVDIVVATPGRLLDLVTQRHLRLDAVTHLVLDEADRMLDMGFIRDVRKIIAALPRERQSLLFSATMPADVEHLAHDILKAPLRIEVTPKVVTVDKIDQRVVFVEAARKASLLAKLLADPAMERVIVFTRTKHRANRVAEQLGKVGFEAEAIHGNKSQGARQRALERFRSGDARVLVATDIAARGIDIDNITHVVNFELPNEPESYVHRIGRTARAGTDGIAVSFCAPDERSFLRDIERLTRRPLVVVDGRLWLKDLGEPGPEQAPANESRAPRQQQRRDGGRPQGQRPQRHAQDQQARGKRPQGQRHGNGAGNGARNDNRREENRREESSRNDGGRSEQRRDMIGETPLYRPKSAPPFGQRQGLGRPDGERNEGAGKSRRRFRSGGRGRAA
jgi:ATP-dependent RNA helicase RhlE